MILNLACSEKWKYAVFSPENYPAVMHYHKLIEKYIGKPLRGKGRMNIEEMKLGVKFVKEHFFFIDALEEDVTLDSIMKSCNI